MADQKTRTYIALLRGVNVGKAKRIAMADLRALVEELGFSGVRTLLNSGNVIFSGEREDTAGIAPRISDAIANSHAFTANVVVLDQKDLEKVIEANPLPHEELDHSRLLVAFAQRDKDLEPAKPMNQESWGREEIVVSGLAAYISVPDGVPDSIVMKEFWKVTKELATARNWKTVLKIMAAARTEAIGTRSGSDGRDRMD